MSNLTAFDLVDMKIDAEQKALKPITPDEEWFMHLEDEVLSRLTKKGVDYAVVMSEVYEALDEAFKKTEKCGAAFAASILSKNMLRILKDYEREIRR